MNGPYRFQPRPARLQKPTAKPRRVVGGVKLRSREGPDLKVWAAQRWMRLVETNATGPSVTEGQEYARLGQARTLDLQPGLINSRVQGRMPDSYSVSIRLPTFTPEQWEQVLASMTGQARYAASLLSGDLPAGIEDVFAPMGLRLFPVESSELAVSCTCGGWPATTELAAPTADGRRGPEVRAAPTSTAPFGWCKHICCVMTLVADRFGMDPLVIFTLRGMRGDDLLERLRQQRAAAGSARSGASGAGGGEVPIYVPHLPGVNDRPAAPLEESLATFWSLGPGLEELELPIGPPEVSHPLLRRLGPSPFDPATAKFPLVGLLATCYDVISAAAVREEEGGDGGA